MLKSINPPGSVFSGVSQAMQVVDGDLLIMGGHVPADADGNLVAGSLEAQLVAVFEGIKRTLNAAGVGFEAVARLTYYVAKYDPEMLPVIREVRSRYINMDVPPASAVIPVAQLYDESVLVEVDGFAVIPRR